MQYGFALPVFIDHFSGISAVPSELTSALSTLLIIQETWANDQSLLIPSGTISGEKSGVKSPHTGQP